MDVIVKLCEHVFVMAAGRLLCEGAPEAVTTDARVIEAYLGGAPARAAGPILTVERLVAGDQPGLPIVNAASIHVARGEIVALPGLTAPESRR